MLFLDDQWFDEMARRTREHLNRPGILNVTYCEVFTDCPDTEDTVWIFTVIRDGILQDILKGRGSECVPVADVCCTGTYTDHVAVLRGQLSLESAILTGKLKVRGKLLKGLKFILINKAFSKGKRVPNTIYLYGPALS